MSPRGRDLLEHFGRRVLQAGVEVIVQAGEAATDVVLEEIEAGAEKLRAGVARARARSRSRSQ